MINLSPSKTFGALTDEENELLRANKAIPVYFVDFEFDGGQFRSTNGDYSWNGNSWISGDVNVTQITNWEQATIQVPMVNTMPDQVVETSGIFPSESARYAALNRNDWEYNTAKIYAAVIRPAMIAGWVKSGWVKSGWVKSNHQHENTVLNAHLIFEGRPSSMTILDNWMQFSFKSTSLHSVTLAEIIDDSIFGRLARAGDSFTFDGDNYTLRGD